MNYVKRPRLKRDSRKRNRLRIEILEDRRLLAATATADTNRFDVNQDGHVTAVDALQVINYLSLNANGSGEEQTTQKQSAPPSAFDVNQDGNVSPVDALQIINLLNESPGPETASALQSEPSPSASVTLPSQARTRDIVELSIDSFSDLDLTSIDRVEIDWGDDRVTSVPADDIALPLTRLHSYFVPRGTRGVEVNAVAQDGSTVSLASLPIEIVANSPSIVDRDNEGLTAEIFDNTDFSFAPVQIRNDATINFDFGIGGPSPTLGPTALPFSIRWQGTFTPQETASHNLFADVGANDSAAVYVDNQLLFTAAGNEQSASIPLTAGQSVELRVEYVAGSGQSHIRVGSETESSFKTAFPSHQLNPTISAEQLRSGALIETFEAPTLITSVEELRSSQSFTANTPVSANDLAGLTYSPPAGAHATRTRSIVSVPVSGRYTFHLAASDTAEVYLSQGVTSDTSRVIVSVDNEAPPEDFDSPNANASTPIYLVAGQDYYLETLHVHDNASTASHLAVAWTRPDQVELGPQLIDAAFLRPIVPEVTLHADVSQTHEADIVSRNARFVIARSDDLGRNLDVAYTLGGSATNGVDYSQLSGIATIPAGQDHVIVELDPVDDATLEGPEIAVVRLASDARYQLGVESQRQIQITIAGELQNETQLLPQDIPTLINTGFSSAAGSNQITTFQVNDTSLPFVDGSPTDNTIRAVVTTATPDSPWDTLIGYGFDGSPYPAGTPFFASVWARSGNIDGSDATVGLRLQKSGGDYAGEEKVWQVGPEWTLLLLPMTPDFGNGTSDRTVDVRLGYQEQTVELGGFSLVKLDQQSDLDEAPKTIYTYGGRQWDANWREQAANDAATHRTNPIQIKIVDAAGNPIEGAVVTITPTTPSLPIGTAVSPELIVASNPDSLTPEAQRYQAILEMFDTITDGGTAQWGPWSLDPQVPRDFLDWVIERDLPYHGHALVWGDLADDPSDNFPTPVSLLDGYNHQLSTNGAAAAETWLENEILTHVSTTGPANDFSGSREDSSEPRVTWWDVINHPIFAPEIWDIVGYDFIVDILQATRNTVDSNTDLIINEFDILSNPDNGQSDAFFDLLTHLDTTANAATGANAQYDAIGFQGHFVSNRLPDIDRIMQELDRYEVFDRDMQITEFDVDAVDIDPQTQADFTRDFYQTLAATPTLTAATLWGIWSGDHWRETQTNPESAALFNQDWTPRPSGQWLLDELDGKDSSLTHTTNHLMDSVTPQASIDLSRVDQVHGVYKTLLTIPDDNSGNSNSSYVVTVRGISPTADFGDAPNSYATALSSNGARHTATGPTLGASRDTEFDGQPSVLADGDDLDGNNDEDGVDAPALIYPGSHFDFTINSSEVGKIDAWIDYNRNGLFDHPSELILDSVSVVAGANSLKALVPSMAASGNTYARFRISTAGGLSPLGIANNGEVEDYPVTIANIRRFTVNTSDDTSDASPGDGFAFDTSGNTSLRAAIEEANALPNLAAGSDEIYFDIPDAGPHVITLATQLPAITDEVLIDATSEPDYAGAPVVQIDGGGPLDRGLRFLGAGAAGSEVAGLSVTGFDKAGVEITNTSGVTVTDNYLGLDTAGLAVPNFHGLKIINATDNLVDRNVLSGNTSSGVFINTTMAGNNTLTNNLAGTDPAGMVARPNGNDGINLRSAGNTIGTPGNGNLVSGNLRWGVFSSQPGKGSNTIQGNSIGVDATGLDSLPNFIGVYLQNGDNVVGGTATDESNVISGNTLHGMLIGFPDATDNEVFGNFIGTDGTGTVDVGNGLMGIFLAGGEGNQIGGTATGQLNVISGNGQHGVLVAYDITRNNTIAGNRIGTDLSGTVGLPNDSEGIRMVQGANNNTVTGNVIAGNGGRGVVLDGAYVSGNQLIANTIGLDVSQNDTLPNGTGGAVLVKGPDTEVLGNTISSVDFGVLLFGDQASGSDVDGNFIGTNASGDDLGMDVGVYLLGAVTGTTISDNAIGFNNKAVVLKNTGNGNAIRQNAIFANAVIGIDLNNDGASVNDAGDGDEGENRMQNKATSLVVTATTIGASEVNIQFDYEVDTAPANATYPLTVEFFLSDASGQGIYYLTSDTYTAPGLATFDEDFNIGSFPFIPEFGTAMVTDAAGNTSEYSLPVPVTVDRASGGSGDSSEPLAALPPTPARSYQTGDANRDGQVTAIDALQIINYLNAQGKAAELNSAAASPGLDVSGDGEVTAVDALQVINHLNAQGAASLVDDAFANWQRDLNSDLLTNDELLERVNSESRLL